MVFAYPHMLWLLLLAVAIGGVTYAVMRRSTRPARRLGVTLTRVACLAAAILALSRPLVPWRSGGHTTVFVADLSPSVAGEEIARVVAEIRSSQGLLKPPNDLRVVAFASRAELLEDLNELDADRIAALRQRLDEPLIAGDLAGGGSALADALRLAGASVGAGRNGKLIVFTDGLETRGDAAAETKRLADRGFAVQVEALKPIAQPLCLIDGLELPTSAAIGATVPVRAIVRSNHQIQARIELSIDGKPVARNDDIADRPGRQEVLLDLPLGKAGLNKIEAKLTMIGETGADEIATAAIWVAPPARVLVVDGAGDGRTGAALAKLLGASAAVASAQPSELDSAARLAEVDLLVLSNTPADRVSTQAQENVDRAAAAGMGVLVTGGPVSFGPGGWAGSHLAEILPVLLPQ